MIRLAWVDNYDVAVLVSSDRDFVPVAEFLETRGIKVIHGAFPPKGAHPYSKMLGAHRCRGPAQAFQTGGAQFSALTDRARCTGCWAEPAQRHRCRPGKPIDSVDRSRCAGTLLRLSIRA
ncbi:NYN domain-containing protein [Candidatus Palauibacter sp.]